jgi:hypothetical protein
MPIAYLVERLERLERLERSVAVERLEPSCSNYCLFARSLRFGGSHRSLENAKDQRSAIKICDINEHEQMRLAPTNPAVV